MKRSLAFGKPAHSADEDGQIGICALAHTDRPDAQTHRCVVSQIPAIKQRGVFGQRAQHGVAVQFPPLIGEAVDGVHHGPFAALTKHIVDGLGHSLLVGG